MFQLVLQFRPWGAKGIEDLFSVETKLITALGGMATVDGHDIGSNEANIFVHCVDPWGTLTYCVPVIDAAGLLPIFSAAHRPLDGDRYIRDWPVGNTAAFDVK